MSIQYHDGNKWTDAYPRPPLRRPVVVAGGIYYDATKFGVSSEAEDNTPAMQALIDLVAGRGGGVIWMPPGVYDFKRCGVQYDKQGFLIDYALRMESGVSVVGAGKGVTILRQTEGVPYALFLRMATAEEPLTGCTFCDFAVDAYATGDVGNVYGKAFYGQYLRDCVFRDLVLLGTPATALGVDYLDCVYIDRVTCVDCGRTWKEGTAGTSGIGIGVGGWADENCIIDGCIAIRSGQYGIFFESQPQMGWGGNYARPRGMIVSNCIARDGFNKGIGIIGVENVTVIGCESYGNVADGYYVDLDCRNVRIRGCSGTGNGGRGILLNAAASSRRIEVHGCSFVDNAAEGIYASTGFDKLVLMNNYTDGNRVGYGSEAVVLPDCVVKGNAFLDGTDSRAMYTGDTRYNEVGEGGEPPIVLYGGDLIEDVKIMPDGGEAVEADARCTGYLDVSDLGDFVQVTTTYKGALGGIRVAQYDADRQSLVTNAPLQTTLPSPWSLAVELIEGAEYIRVFYARADEGKPAQVEQVVVSEV